MNYLLAAETDVAVTVPLSYLLGAIGTLGTVIGILFFALKASWEDRVKFAESTGAARAADGKELAIVVKEAALEMKGNAIQVAELRRQISAFAEAKR